jgi:hypothetical protein
MQEVITPTDYQMPEFPPDQMPIWMSDHNLGDAGYRLDAFIVSQQYKQACRTLSISVRTSLTGRRSFSLG